MSMKSERLQALRLQEARYGLNCPPEISIEIREIEKSREDAKFHAQLIATHRRNVRHYMDQVSIFGANVPAHVSNQLAYEREQIEMRKENCAKLGWPVADDTVDFTPIREIGAIKAPRRVSAVIAEIEALLGELKGLV